MIKKYVQMKNDTIFSGACMQHGMPQSLIVFAVSSRLETPKFETFSEVTHHP